MWQEYVMRVPLVKEVFYKTLRLPPSYQAHMRVLNHFSHVLLFETLWTVAPPGFSVHGTLQARILEWVAMHSPGDLPDAGQGD